MHGAGREWAKLEERPGGSRGSSKEVPRRGSLSEPMPFMQDLCLGAEVVPARLVRKISRGEFVDKSELLKDNMELERRRAACSGEPSQGQLAGRTGRREVSDVMSWLHSFYWP